ncbi:MAG: RES family NAD+ phosphorylase [Oscillospiraceae bacterium]|nr:RES family NAD+ phosphorylase [Oscillospiraceae bacterium]
MDYSKDTLFNIWVLYALVQNEKEKWDEYRNEAVELTDPVIKELEDYFRNIFKIKIPQYTLPVGTSLFRARQIKSNEWNQVEVDVYKLKDEFFKIFLSDTEIESAKKLDLHISLETLFCLKTLAEKELEGDQLKNLDKLTRKYSAKEFFYGFAESGCGVPPEEYRKSGRLNAEKDEYLYLALEKDTAIYEMRPSISQIYSVATCKSNKELVLVDFRPPHELNSDNFFIYSLADKISEPNTDNNKEFYHITQYLSHFLQNKGYDGIIYTSAIKKDGINVMLFDKKNVNFTSSEIVSIDNININHTTQLPLKKR